jgi:XRE family aerobic/anaerobic benzoate catabolism transcriptional regulator
MDEDARHAELGRRVRALREARTMTKKTLAEKSGLSARFLSDVEAGRANPSIGSLNEIASALDVDVTVLVGRAPLSDAHASLLGYVSALDEGGARAALELLRAHKLDRALRPITLLGLRGAGKSSVGEALAERMGRRFLELDRLIEQEAGMTLGALFELHGEGHVRQLEQRVLESSLDKGRPAVLATGGGVVMNTESWDLLKARSTTVWLRATPQQHWDRVVQQGDMRPMANRTRARSELEALFDMRAPLYERADLVVETSDVAVDGVVERILDELGRGRTPATSVASATRSARRSKTRARPSGAKGASATAMRMSTAPPTARA